LLFVLKGCSTVQILYFRILSLVPTRGLTFIEVNSHFAGLAIWSFFFFIPFVVVDLKAVWCSTTW
jgi:hypothetical protein